MNLPRLSERVICLIDMDCFYVQVEEIAAPEFRGKPCGVSQYNPYKGGGLIAVNYEARKFGIKRGMRGEDAKKLCPEFNTFYVSQKRGKADLTKYREASVKIFEIILKHCQNVEKASIDEAYLDLTDMVNEKILQKAIDSVALVDSFVVGTYGLNNENDPVKNLNSWLEINLDLSRECSDVALIIGAYLVQEIRQDIFNTLGYHCSAGIAHNKTLAKLCCGLNKPNKQTILPLNSVESLLENIAINKIKNLGGKLGVILNEQFGLNTVGQLAKQPLNDLIKNFGEKTGTWLHQISHGIDLEPVMSRQAAKSIGCSKNFRGKLVLNTVNKVEYWVRQLCEELEERLESDKNTNQREPTLLVLHVTNEAGTFSKSLSLNSSKNSANYFISQSIEALNGFNKSKIKEQWIPGIYTLGISAAKFLDLDKSKASNSIQNYFNSNKNKSNENEIEINFEAENVSNQACSSSYNLEEQSDTNENSTSNTNSIENHNKSNSNSNNSTNNKNTIKQDIKTMLLNQKEKPVKKDDESDLDAENISENEDLIVIEKVDKKNGKKKIENFFKKSSNDQVPVSSSLEDIDYVLCTQCNKKILCWDMPEHEDFHFAQMISRQQAVENSVINNNTSKKRIAEESHNQDNKKENLVHNQKELKNSKNKKLKTDLAESIKSNVKSIDNYFKKSNNK